MHLTLVPYIKSSGEMKTKPTQHSVKELRGIGIQPDILVCRTDRPLPETEKKKIALFTNVPVPAVISAIDVDDIYKIPAWLHEQGMDQLVVDHFGLNCRKADLSQWERVVDARGKQDGEVEIAMVGKYGRSDRRLQVAQRGAGARGTAYRHQGEDRYVEAEAVEAQGTRILQGADAILVRAALAIAASKARSPLRTTPAPTASRTWASASACRSPPSNSRATSAGSRMRTAPR